ncbi:hypothetical protein ABZ916_39385 [Streptomyces sp. NPDC046853]|uniref:hypothetical protein n=1 Tax=Streptomyces sp. NPDC046853 TaxID=3154920 RepID=UPI0033F13367
MSDQTPEVIVSVTCYTVSVLPMDDINHRAFALYVELRPGGWIVHTGHEYYTAEGAWEPGMASAHRFADCDEALALAKVRAPHLELMGHTAVDAYRRTQGEVQS